MATELAISNISTYLTITQFHLLNWQGTQQGFLLHYKEQARHHNAIVKIKYKDSQLVGFLNQCLSGTSNLSHVLQNHQNSMKAACAVGAVPQDLSLQNISKCC